MRMAVIVPWQPDNASREVLAHLAAGECVALPTESTYEIVASALSERGVERMRSAASEQPAVALTEVAEVADWLPLLSGGGARLVRKLGPGPYVLRADAGHRTGLFQRLPEFARGPLATDAGLSVRLPDHPIWAELRRAGLPLLSAPIADAVDASAAARLVGAHAAAIVDSGGAQFALPPSVIQVDGRRARLVAEGGLKQELFDKITLCRVLFVCTGNTCRSPMAEVLCAKMLADRLGCAPGALEQHGFCVQSAGLAATMGGEAADEAVQVVASLGADLTKHQTRPATIDMLLWADFVFGMTAAHWHTLRSIDLANLPMPWMLSPAYEDIADPIGGALIDYQTCANQILECLHQRLPQLLES